MRERLRSVAVFAVKALVAAGILGWLFSKMDVGRVQTTVQNARISDLWIAVLLMASTLPIVGWRWQRLLRVYGIDLPLPLLMTTVHVGQLFALVLPGSLGEDFIRTTYIANVSRRRTSVVLASVLADRIAALLGLLFLALLAAPAHWGLLQNGGMQTRLLSFGMLGAAVCTLLGIAILQWVSLPRLREWMLPMFVRLPGGSRMKEWFVTLETLIVSRGVFRQVMAGALATQMVLCGVFYFCGTAVGVEASPLTWLGFVPIILAANVIPVTVAGIGIREYLLVLFLGEVVSVDQTQAMAVSLLVLAVCLFQSFSGVVSYLWIQPRLAAAVRADQAQSGTPLSNESGAIVPKASEEDEAITARASRD
jgi:uncharacterized membrane protein YbhN (UPF0104 family)